MPAIWWIFWAFGVCLQLRNPKPSPEIQDFLESDIKLMTHDVTWLTSWPNVSCNSSRPTPRQTSCKKWLLRVYFFSEANMFSKKYFPQFIRRHSSLLSDRWSPGLWQALRSLYRCETSRTSNCWSVLFVSESWVRLKNVLELKVDTNIMIKNTTAVTIGEKKT